MFYFSKPPKRVKMRRKCLIALQDNPSDGTEETRGLTETRLTVSQANQGFLVCVNRPPARLFDR